MIKRHIVSVLFTVIFVPSWAVAQESRGAPLVTDRPDFTESTETISPLRVQIEFGYTFEKSGDTEAHTVGEILARLGVRDNLELRLGLNSYTRVDVPGGGSTGLEDSFLGFKLKLLEAEEEYGNAFPHLALLGGTSIPTGGEEVTTNEWEPELILALSWDLSDRFALGSNLHYAYLSGGNDRFSQFGGSISLGYSLSEKTGAYFEYYGFVSTGEEIPDTGFLNGGFTYLAHADFQLDIRAGVGLNRPKPEYLIGLGAAMRL